MRAKWFVGLVMCLVVGGLGSAAAAGPSAEGIYCGENLNHSIIATNDLAGCPAASPAITIVADNVTLDLGGHHINSDGSGGGIGIDVPNRRGVAIRNGTIIGFSAANVALQQSSSTKVVNMTTEGGNFGVADIGGESDTILHARSSGSSYGFYLEDTLATKVIRSVASDAWLRGIYLLRADQSTLARNRLRNNPGGVLLTQSSNNLITRNQITGGYQEEIKLDVDSASNIVRGNTVMHTEDDGIYDAGTANQIIGNTIAHVGNLGIGVDLPSNANFLSLTVVSGNRVMFTGGLGIQSPAGITNARNNVRGSADPHECSVGLTCYVP